MRSALRYRAGFKCFRLVLLVTLACGFPVAAGCGDNDGAQEECGDGTVDPGEACDDGNLVDGDGCDASCQIETDPVCGDGTVDPGEACDDGNTRDTDACLRDCTEASCGDSHVWGGQEECDDGNTTPGDGCDGSCQIEPLLCEPVQQLSCGGSVSSNNSATGSTHRIDEYSCISIDESGPEIAYEFVAPASGVAAATLTGLTANLDVWILEERGGGCEPNHCVGPGEDEALANVTEGTTYYIVVDGWSGEVGNFTLTLTCP